MNKDADLNNAKSEAKSNATRAVAAYLQVLNCFIFAFRVVLCRIRQLVILIWLLLPCNYFIRIKRHSRDFVKNEP